MTLPQRSSVVSSPTPWIRSPCHHTVSPGSTAGIGAVRRAGGAVVPLADGQRPVVVGAAQVVVGDVVLERAQQDVAHRLRDRHDVQHAVGRAHVRQRRPALERAERRAHHRRRELVDLGAVGAVPRVVARPSRRRTRGGTRPGRRAAATVRSNPSRRAATARATATPGCAPADAVGVADVAVGVEPRRALGLVRPERVEEAADGDHPRRAGGPRSAAATSTRRRSAAAPTTAPRTARRRGRGSAPTKSLRVEVGGELVVPRLAPRRARTCPARRRTRAGGSPAPARPARCRRRCRANSTTGTAVPASARLGATAATSSRTPGRRARRRRGRRRARRRSCCLTVRIVAGTSAGSGVVSSGAVCTGLGDDVRATASRAMRKPALTFSSLPSNAAVLVLDDDGVVVAGPVQRADEAVPADLAEPGRRGTCQPMPADSTPWS